MMFAQMYDVCSTVRGPLNFMMSVYLHDVCLYGVRSTVLCLPTCVYDVSNLYV